MTASLVSRDSWADLIPPDDLPERDVYADLGDGAPPSEARRAAEKLFGRFVADQKPVPTQVASEAPIPLRSRRSGLQVFRALALVTSSILFISSLRFLCGPARAASNQHPFCRFWLPWAGLARWSSHDRRAPRMTP